MMMMMMMVFGDGEFPKEFQYFCVVNVRNLNVSCRISIFLCRQPVHLTPLRSLQSAPSAPRPENPLRIAFCNSNYASGTLAHQTAEISPSATSLRTLLRTPSGPPPDPLHRFLKDLPYEILKLIVLEYGCEAANYKLTTFIWRHLRSRIGKILK